MASWFTHALVAGVLGKAHQPGVRTTRFWMLSIICSVFPDVDVLGFFWGIEYGHVLGHRGVMHSLGFALILALVTVASGFSGVSHGSKTWWLLVLHFFLVTASHGVLDAMTNGGLGVAFFAPFENSRYFFPWTPIQVSPIGAGFFGMQGLRVLGSEILYVWLPILIVANAMSLFLKTTMKSG
ncbi:MAG: metal-dependent hydrolase [Nitrospirae bacterium]|nr:metal-dependent hydrolase [Nitrospirota bacterium]MDA1304743.1 metal-dependent hydrolase [Nitrospirota bacterium]